MTSSERPAEGVTMTRGKPIQEGVRVKLPEGMSWAKLAGDESRGDPGE